MEDGQASSFCSFLSLFPISLSFFLSLCCATCKQMTNEASPIFPGFHPFFPSPFSFSQSSVAKKGPRRKGKKNDTFLFYLLQIDFGQMGKRRAWLKTTWDKKKNPLRTIASVSYVLWNWLLPLTPSSNTIFVPAIQFAKEVVPQNIFGAGGKWKEAI